MPLIERAPAKINLTLHIVGRRPDGWHTLESLVAFSRGGDQLALAEGEALGLSIEGPTASAAGEVADNLVLRAARHFAENFPAAKLGSFHLIKRLPVAAGIGGGSSDAAAALRLLARANGVGLDDARLFTAARKTGADVSVCVAARARMMRGLGEELGPLLNLPPLVGLIVNPGAPLESRSVFAAMNIAPGAETGFGAHPRFSSGMPVDDLIAALRKGRNDMEIGGLPARPYRRRRARGSFRRARLPARAHVGVGRHLLRAIQELQSRGAREKGDSAGASRLVGEKLRLRLTWPWRPAIEMRQATG